MAKSRFERVDTTTLKLNDDDWIEVRKRLSGGEQKKMGAAAFTGMQQGPGGPGDVRISIDFAALSLSRTKAYLVDWGGPGFSVEDEKSGRTRPIACTSQSIEALDADSLQAIEDALDVHIAAMNEEKKLQNGEPPPSPA